MTNVVLLFLHANPVRLLNHCAMLLCLDTPLFSAALQMDATCISSVMALHSPRISCHINGGPK